MTRQTLGWLGAALLLRVAANVIVRQLGFIAISDDDYARTVIAQNFAHAPSWDPSGTSWLPFPFWLTGATMALFGSQLAVAHTLAWVTSLACVPAFFLAASWCEQSPRWAGWSTCVFAVFPNAVWLDLATVPEGYAAVVATLALASCNRTTLGARLLGTTCITLASLSRYELWPIAIVVAALQTKRPVGLHPCRAKAGLLALSALVGPACWLLHGSVNHGSPLFFVTRVASYRTLLGQAPDTWLEILTNYPLALVAASPEFTLLCVATIVAVLLPRFNRSAIDANYHALRYPLLGALCTFVFLVWADTRNGAPTHHPERVLQACWLSMLLALGVAWQRAARLRASKTLALCAVPLVALGLQRTHAQRFVDRSPEVAAGGTFSQRLNETNRLLIETRGYGYTAVAAGTGQPWNVVGFNPDDPRQKPTLWNTPEALSDFVAQQRVRWLVVPPERVPLATRVARVVGESGVGVTLEVQ